MAPPFNIVQDGGQLNSSAWSSVPYLYNEKIGFNNYYDYFTKPQFKMLTTPMATFLGHKLLGFESCNFATLIIAKA